MSMYDEVTILEPIKGLTIKHYPWDCQTNSMECSLSKYEITEGRLYELIPILRKPTKEEINKRKQESKEFRKKHLPKGWKWIVAKLYHLLRIIRELNPINHRVCWHNARVALSFLLGVQSHFMADWGINAKIVTGYNRVKVLFHGDMEVCGESSLKSKRFTEAVIRFNKGKVEKVLSCKVSVT